MIENDCQILSAGEKIAIHGRGALDRMTVLSGSIEGCLKHLKISSFQRLYRLVVPSFELVAKNCMSW